MKEIFHSNYIFRPTLLVYFYLAFNDDKASLFKFTVLRLCWIVILSFLLLQTYYVYI